MYTALGKVEKTFSSNLLNEYSPLVRRLALKMMAKLPTSVQVDDLIQAGMIGLLEAGARYEEYPGAKFETYATQCVRGAMLDELRKNDWASRGIRKSTREVSKAIQIQSHQLGRAPTEAEISKQMEIPLEVYQKLLQEIHGCQIVYYDDFGHDEDGAFGGNLLDKQECSAKEPLTEILEGEFRRRLILAIEKIPEREKLLLNLIYDQEMNLREVGAILEVSQPRVCQIHSQAINRLRAGLGDLVK
jgi:RNA polymerase sigma factor for flagellar operon FliA